MIKALARTTTDTHVTHNFVLEIVVAVVVAEYKRRDAQHASDARYLTNDFAKCDARLVTSNSLVTHTHTQKLGTPPLLIKT